MLYDLSCVFAQEIEIDSLVPAVIARARELFDAPGASVLLLDTDQDHLYFPYVDEEDPDAARSLLQLHFPLNEGIAGYVVRTGKPARSDSVRDDPRFFAGADQATQTQTGPLIAAPLICRRTTIGVIEVIRRHGERPFSDEDLTFLETLAASVAVGIDNALRWSERKASEQRLQTLVDELSRNLARRDTEYEILGKSAAIQDLVTLIEAAARHPITVLIKGETGTGKERVARRIHRLSSRRDSPFLAVNCAAVSPHLLESELFGHRKGSFTDAHSDRIGLFEAASGGTIFLDEVAECPPEMQGKLLRVLQEGEILPVGENRPRRIDVRVISASNCELEVEIADGNFREDLYYRLAAFPIAVPALRERSEDIPLLAENLLARANELHGRDVKSIDGGAMEVLSGSHWPGNIRQLQHEIERAVVLAADSESLQAEHLSPQLIAEIAEMRGEEGGAGADPSSSESNSAILPLREARDRFEAAYLRRALISCGGNVSATARTLGMSRFMVQKKIKDHGIK